MNAITLFSITVPFVGTTLVFTILVLISSGLNGGDGVFGGASAASTGVLAAPPTNGRNGPRSSSSSSSGVPLVGEDTNNRRRKGKKNTDCHFGRSKYELGETWHPDLGPPFGVLSCVECECVSVQKKRRIVGRVKCRNTKNECPEPNCEDPVLLTGRCCKTCPQNEVQMEQKPRDETEKNGHEYAALMTSDPETMTIATSASINAVASGRFVLHKRNLHYSIQYIGVLTQPTFVAFTDEKGHIIEDQQITHVTYLQNSSYKICGVWLKVPKPYREDLALEELFVRITNPTDGDIVVGRLTKFYSAALKKETFSTVLTTSGATDAESRNGWTVKPSGLAIISTASINGAAHFYIVLKNMAQLEREQKVSVRLESLNKEEDDAVVIEETFVITKSVKNNAVAELKMNFDAKVFRQMARGKLLLSVAPNKNLDSNRISGLISPKVSCNTIHHAILSLAVDDESGPPPTITGAGQAVMRLTDDGNIIYKIQIEGIQGMVTHVGLATLNKKRWRPIHNMTSSYKDGWANGTLPRLSARDVELLTGSELHVIVGTDRYPVYLIGLVKQRLFGEAQSGDFFPILLRGASTAGQAWMAVDNNCRLFYEVVVGQQQQTHQPQFSKKFHSGRGKDSVDEVGMVELVDIGVMADERTGTGSRELQIRQEFVGYEVEDVADEISKPGFARLGSGNAILHVSINSSFSGNISRLDLHARVNNLHVPSACLPDRSENEVPIITPPWSEELYDDSAKVTDPEPFRCSYEDRIVEDGSHWTPSKNACLMCSCRRGSVICEATICPTLNCPNARVPPGECCPVCEGLTKSSLYNSSSRGCYFDGDKKYHKPGSKWYPYLTPFGFSMCAICTCNATSLTVNCSKIVCKALSCPEKDAYRKHAKDCCKTCPDPPVMPITNAADGEQQDQGCKKTPEELLAEGGCKHNGEVMPNGKEWHPRVQPFGDIRCVKCSCKDGKTKCKRKKCPPTNCHNKTTVDNECCPRCIDGSNGTTG